MKKSELAISALMAVSGLFGKYAATGTKIDTQESDFKSVAQAVNDALNAPEDKEPLPAIVEIPPITPELLRAGFDSVIASMPKPQEPAPAIDESKLFDFIEGAILRSMENMMQKVKEAQAAADAEAAKIAALQAQIAAEAAQESPAVAG